MGRNLNIARWVAASASVIGRGHQRSGTPCQDRSLTSSTESAVAVVADGAGSRTHSQVGAEHVCRIISDLFQTRFEELYAFDSHQLCRTILSSIGECLQPVAASMSVRPDDLASTLLFVAVNAGRYVAGNLGDGVVAIQRNGRCEVLCTPERGEFANQTVFVTCRDAVSRLNIVKGITDGVSGFALMTDGTSAALYDAKNVSMAPAVDRMWKWLDSYAPKVISAQLAASIRDVIQKRTSDDCSLALMKRVSVPIADLHDASSPFLRSILGCKTTAGARTRLAVLNAAWLDLLGYVSNVDEIVAMTGLTKNTVKRHIRALEPSFEWHWQVDQQQEEVQ